MTITAVRQSGWSPEQVAVIAPILFASISSAAVSIVTAIRQRGTNKRVDALHQEVRPPSNGKSAGTLLENTAYALHAMASIYAKEHGVEPLPPITQKAPLPDRRAAPEPEPTP